MSKELSVTTIMNEINDVLKKHLVSIIEKNKNDKEHFENFIKNLPFIKNIVEENQNLKEEVDIHKKQVVFLNDNLASLSKKYTELFFTKNKLKASVNLQKECKNIDKSNIELVVDDTKSERTDINENDIIKEVEENLEKKKKNLLEKKTAIDMYLNNYEVDDDIFSAEEMKDSQKGDEENEEIDNNIYKSILKAQNAGEYATIDTASEEEEDEEDKEEKVSAVDEQVDNEEDKEEEKEDDEEQEEREEQEEDEEQEEREEQEEDEEQEEEEEEEEEEEQEKEEEEEEQEKEEEEEEHEEVVEEEEEEDEEEEEEEEDEEEEHDEEQEDVVEEEEEEEEVVEIDFEGSKYYGSEDAIGKIYEYMDDGEIGDEVGHYVNGLPIIF